MNGYLSKYSNNSDVKKKKENGRVSLRCLIYHEESWYNLVFVIVFRVTLTNYNPTLLF